MAPDDSAEMCASMQALPSGTIMAPTPTTYITDAVEVRMLEATTNGVYNVKRSLLDFIELQELHLKHRGELTDSMFEFFEMMRKRIHNDVSQIEYILQAVIGMAKRGGDIPRFGRSQEQIEAAERKKRDRKDR